MLRSRLEERNNALGSCRNTRCVAAGYGASYSGIELDDGEGRPCEDAGDASNPG